jgi:hypothetical protein
VLGGRALCVSPGYAQRSPPPLVTQTLNSNNTPQNSPQRKKVWPVSLLLLGQQHWPSTGHTRATVPAIQGYAGSLPVRWPGFSSPPLLAPSSCLLSSWLLSFELSHKTACHFNTKGQSSLGASPLLCMSRAAKDVRPRSPIDGSCQTSAMMCHM